MNHTRLPKEVLLPDWARRDNQVTKGQSCILCLQGLSFMKMEAAY
jgi:hypothetical protein